MRVFSRFVFILGLSILLIAGGAIITNHQGFAQRLIIFAFWISVFATIYYVKEVKNK